MGEETLAKKFGVPSDDQLAKINRFAKRPFSAGEVFAFPAKMIGDAVVPNRYMRLHPDLLTEFTKQANGGNVAFMMNHRWAAWFGLSEKKGPMNVGRVFKSWMAESHDLPDETVAQFGEVYIPRGKEKDGVKTDEVIESIEDGTQFDVSIGFGFNKAECSICGKDIRDKYRDDGCKHYPGRAYDDKLCVIVAKPPGDQFELSAVYAGAYPTAGTLGANATDPAPNVEEVVYAEDLTKVEVGARIVGAYGRGTMNLWVPKDAIQRTSFSIGSNTTVKGGEKVEGEKEKSAWDKFGETAEALGLSAEQMTNVLSKFIQLSNDSPARLSDLVASLDTVTGVEVKEGGHVILAVQSPDTIQTGTLDLQAVKQTLGKEYDLPGVLTLAKDGLVLREQVIDDCVKMRVRAQGNAFDADTYKETLHKANFSIDEIQALTEGFRAAAGEVLAPGRKTVPTDNQAQPKSHVPAEAFQVRKK